MGGSKVPSHRLALWASRFWGAQIFFSILDKFEIEPEDPIVEVSPGTVTELIRDSWSFTGNKVLLVQRINHRMQDCGISE
jgi:hypothetical protein